LADSPAPPGRTIQVNFPAAGSAPFLTWTVEEDFRRADRLVARGVDREDPHFGRLGDDHLVAQHGDAERPADRFVLGEGLGAVRFPVAIASRMRMRSPSGRIVEPR
jgi:hypothetical protein